MRVGKRRHTHAFQRERCTPASLFLSFFLALPRIPSCLQMSLFFCVWNCDSVNSQLEKISLTVTVTACRISRSHAMVAVTSSQLKCMGFLPIFHGASWFLSFHDDSFFPSESFYIHIFIYIHVFYVYIHTGIHRCKIISQNDRQFKYQNLKCIESRCLNSVGPQDCPVPIIFVKRDSRQKKY